MSDRTITLNMDEYPNSLRNRLIRLIVNWDMMNDLNLNTELDILIHLFRISFRDITEGKAYIVRHVRRT